MLIIYFLISKLSVQELFFGSFLGASSVLLAVNMYRKVRKDIRNVSLFSELKFWLVKLRRRFSIGFFKDFGKVTGGKTGFVGNFGNV